MLRDFRQRAAMVIVYYQKALKIFRLLRTSLDGEKVDDLNQEQRLPITCFTHNFNELAQAGNESIVADTQQGTARNIADARGFNDEHARPSFGKTLVPIEV